MAAGGVVGKRGTAARALVLRHGRDLPSVRSCLLTSCNGSAPEPDARSSNFFGSAGERGEQVADLVVDRGLVGVVESRGDTVAEDRLVALAEPLHNLLDRPLARPHSSGEARVWDLAG